MSKSDKLDHFFKEKLQDARIEPSGTAFEKFNQKLNKKSRKIYWYYAAACITLLITLTLVWNSINVDEGSSPQIASNLPTQNGVIEDQPESIEPLSKREEDVSDETGSVGNSTRQEFFITLKLDNKKTSALELSNKSIEIPPSIPKMHVWSPQVVSSETVVDELPPVRITYISGTKKNTLVKNAQTDTLSNKDGAFNKILLGAKSITSGSLIAGFRDKKEQFFNRND